MNELIKIPTIEQINLEHRLAHSKASEALQHATNCGLMLLQVKASLNHGEWGQWVRNAIDRRELEVADRTVRQYMKLAANWQRDANLIEAPSIRAALELLSDKPEGPQQETLLDVEAEREAREKAEQEAKAEREARENAERRAEEFRQESNERRKKIRELESQTGERIIEKEVIPPDYEATKQQLASLQQEYAQKERELSEIRKTQKKQVDEQVNQKLRAHDREHAEKERQIQEQERYLASLQQKIDRYSSAQKELETHLSALERFRIACAEFAANLETCGPMIAPEAETKPTRAIINHMEVILCGLYARIGDTRIGLSTFQPA